MNILGPTIWINCFAFLGYISVKYYRPLGFWSALSFDCNMLKYSNHRWNLSVNQTSAGNSCVSVEEVMGQAMSRSENLNEMEANQQVDEQVGSRFRDAYARKVTECLVPILLSDILPHTHIIISRVDDSTSSSSSISSIHQWFIMASFSSLMAKTRQRWQLLWALCRFSVYWQCLSQTHWQTHCKLWIISWISWLWLLSCLILNRNRKSGKKMMISRFIWSFGRIKLC